MMALVHNLGPSRRRLIGIVHSGMHMRTSGTINRDLRLDPSTSGGT